MCKNRQPIASYLAPQNPSDLAALAKKKIQLVKEMEDTPKLGEIRLKNSNKVIPHYKIEDVKRHLHQKLAVVGLAFSAEVLDERTIAIEEASRNTPGTMYVKAWRSTVVLAFTLTDVDTGAFEISSGIGHAEDNGDKSVSHAASAAFRQWAENTCLLTSAEHRNTEAPPAQKTETTQPEMSIGESIAKAIRTVIGSELKTRGWTAPVEVAAETKKLVDRITKSYKVDDLTKLTTAQADQICGMLANDQRIVPTKPPKEAEKSLSEGGLGQTPGQRPGRDRQDDECAGNVPGGDERHPSEPDPKSAPGHKETVKEKKARVVTPTQVKTFNKLIVDRVKDTMDCSDQDKYQGYLDDAANRTAMAFGQKSLEDIDRTETDNVIGVINRMNLTP